MCLTYKGQYRLIRRNGGEIAGETAFEVENGWVDGRRLMIANRSLAGSFYADALYLHFMADGGGFSASYIKKGSF